MKRSSILTASLALLLSACGSATSSPASKSQQSTSSEAQVSSEFSSEVTSSPVSSAQSSASRSTSSASSEQTSSAEATSSKQTTSQSSSAPKKRVYSQLETRTIKDMPSDFIYGMDASAVPSMEAAGFQYKNEYGETEDVFKILAENGINYIRVRVWNDPYHSTTRKSYGGGNCDLNNAIAIGKRATANGMKLLVDFHYSDFWADPVKQYAPKAWKNYTFAQKKTALYNFTLDSLNAMKEENIDVGMVQVGNETNNFHMCGETEAANAIALMAEGSKAVREAYPKALVAVHFTNPEKKRFPSVASTLSKDNLDYDVFGTSYYPYWHGTLENLAETLSYVGEHYGKKTMVMETSYLWTDDNFDIFGNTEPNEWDTFPQPHTMQGQYDQVTNVIETIGKNTTNGLGVCYWEGTWTGVPNGTKSWSSNVEKWDRYGCGWTTAQAVEYQPDDVTETQGTSVDNQTFFDAQGVLLPSIEAFHHDGSSSEPTPQVTEFLTNGSFETGATSPWQIDILTDGKTSITTFKANTDQYATFPDGTRGLNLWDADPIQGKFYQTVASVPAGSYTFKISGMGVESGATAKPYVLASNGQKIQGSSINLTGYNVWNEQKVEFTLTSAKTVQVGVEFDFTASGCWAWFDAASLKLAS